MALLVDKLRPRTLDSLSYHPELSERLRSLVRAHPLTKVDRLLMQRLLDYRLKAEISLTYSSTDHPEQARRHVSSRH